MSKVSYYGNVGKYDFLHPDKRQYCLRLQTPVGSVSELWTEEDMPDLEDALPSMVLDLIEKRLDSYLFTSRAEKTKPIIAAIREHIKEYDIEWATNYLETAKKEVERRESLLEEVKGDA